MSENVATIAPSEYRNLPVSWIVESPNNPRTRFNETTLAELANSIKAQGVLQPLLVRPINEDTFEVVAGARRLRAARIAEVPTVPVRVVEMSDSAALEATVVENLQRENIHPLEEALGFRALLDLKEPRYTVATIAAKSGKSDAYVYGRLRLADLVPSAAQAFMEDRITLGHALLIAKLPAEQQERALSEATTKVWSSGREITLARPVKEFALLIERTILLSLDNAPFSKADDALVPEAGSCVNCPKRTGHNIMLFAEWSEDENQCTDPQCFARKVDAHVRRELAVKPRLIQIRTAQGEPSQEAVLPRNRFTVLHLQKKKGNNSSAVQLPEQQPCKHMAEAIVVEGFDKGTRQRVCAEPTCTVHHAKVRAARERIWTEHKQRTQETTIALQVRLRVLDAVLKGVHIPLQREDLLFILTTLIKTGGHQRLEWIAQRHRWIDRKDKASTQQQAERKLAAYLRNSDEISMSRLLVEFVLIDSAAAYQSSDKLPEALAAAARTYKVDTAKIAANADREWKERQKAAKPKAAKPTVKRPPSKDKSAA